MEKSSLFFFSEGLYDRKGSALCCERAVRAQQKKRKKLGTHLLTIR